MAILKLVCSYCSLLSPSLKIDVLLAVFHDSGNMLLLVEMFRTRCVPDQHFQNPAGTGFNSIFIESDLILPDNPVITGFFCDKIFIIHPRKYEDRETKRNLP